MYRSDTGVTTAALEAGRPTCDVLVLSGGADYGAFAAGVLEGRDRCARTG